MSSSIIRSLIALSIACYGVKSFQSPPTTFTKRNSPLKTSSSTSLSNNLDDGDVVALFGRLGDKAYVPKSEDVQGTAASGYEFGVLQAGRPKWLCTYTERTGQTQGGGSDMVHVPNWIGGLVENDTIENCDSLKNALEGCKFAMPLSAPSGTMTKGKAPPTEEAVAALWKLLGGSDNGALSANSAVDALRAAALRHGSDTDDHLTYAVFAEALKAL
mmetsp:Transcript_10438/g.11913  ORF Transcript_10438/g.11913 Transcript_10438/m.11913 type:complete len:216 (+) Transcript_10438:99-746(+)|eukprot:CAMPEP_0194378724 /NCGR_PEP_ID=MMETSP0174-20130528/37038_1 /TAXON_ID=216777 /ORGANISM="Proboscia alata, Strain PI-D3" /LENGTH=215 /DNA_ID=CAMNT_0039160963 /DNA_START=60 /DNA_END=707 /DNA_ORIENTATION=-